MNGHGPERIVLVLVRSEFRKFSLILVRSKCFVEINEECQKLTRQQWWELHLWTKTFAQKGLLTADRNLNQIIKSFEMIPKSNKFPGNSISKRDIHVRDLLRPNLSTYSTIWNRSICCIWKFTFESEVEQNNFDSDNWENKLKFDFEGNKMGKIGSLVAKKVLARRKDFYFFIYGALL